MAAKKRSRTEKMLSLFQKEVSTCESTVSLPDTEGERTMTMVELNEYCMRNVFNGLAHVCDHGVRVNPVVFVKVLAVST